MHSQRIKIESLIMVSVTAAVQGAVQDGEFIELCPHLVKEKKRKTM